MSRTLNVYRQIRKWERMGATSHAWIALLRLMESHALSAGVPFSEVRAMVEARVRLGACPDLPSIVRAAELIREVHEAAQARRAAWVSARRAEKRAGRRTTTRQTPLLEHEARTRANVRRWHRVGPWGWKNARGTRVL